MPGSDAVRGTEKRPFAEQEAGRRGERAAPDRARLGAGGAGSRGDGAGAERAAAGSGAGEQTPGGGARRRRRSADWAQVVRAARPAWGGRWAGRQGPRLPWRRACLAVPVRRGPRP